MSNASKQAFRSPSNKKRMETCRKRCENVLFLPRTIRETATATGQTYNACQKRMDEMNQDGTIKEVGKKMERGNLNSVYQATGASELKGKKPSFQKWAKDKKHSAWFEYRADVHHELT